ncbi:MAG TPA: DUF72 domain-containing protein [Longimicrobiales bacterium]|nr:DUF72 domain-containing protein [Longimicrobiales bacterium]
MTARRFHIGTQGWNYDFWNGVFYPPGMKSADRLELYSRVFDSVEIDSTFYAMPPAARFHSWYERTPAGFLFTVKLPRDITHDARLVGADHILHEFCDRAAGLNEKLGPLLVQLPPDMTPRERAAVERFVGILPADFEFAIEFRDARWFDERTLDLLRAHDVALAVSVGPWLTTAQALPIARHAPGRFQYLRWLGAPRHQEITGSLVAERDDDLDAWARNILDSDRTTTYAYFNNDYQGHSPESARRLQKLLGLEPGEASVPAEQGELF